MTRTVPWRLSPRILALLAFPLAIAAPWGASGLSAGVIVIAQTGGEEGFFSFADFDFYAPGGITPSVNSAGEVAFYAAEEFGVAGGIYTGSGGALKTIAHTSRDGFQDLEGAPAINDTGLVAFSGFADDDYGGVWVGDGNALTAIHRGTDPDHFFGFPTINAIGRTSYVSALSDGTLKVVSRRRSDGTDSVVVANNTDGRFDDFPGQPFFGVPSINSNNRVAFYGVTAATGPGVFESKGTTNAVANTIADASLGYDDFRDPVLNGNGALAFWGLSSEGGEQIVFYEDEELRVIVDTLATNQYGFSELGDPALNDEGMIAFWAFLDDGSSGIFRVDLDGTISKLIGSGDAILGRGVLDVGFGNNGLSSAGELAAWALLDDGTEVILRLVAVPEPSAAVLLGLGLAAMAMRRPRAAHMS